MERRVFGATPLEVSVIGFGAGHIGGDQADEQQVSALLNGALDLGINMIDTARGYGYSEERIGRLIGHRRSEYVLSTKIGYGIEGYADWTAPIIHAGVTAALQRLLTDYLDIVHFHSCPLEVLQHTDLLEAISAEVKSGRVRVAAYSGENEALQYAATCGVFGSLQCSINIVDQRGINDLLPVAQQHHLGVIAKRPVANMAWRFPERPNGDYAEVYWDRLKAMQMHPGDLDWLEMALRFTLSVPGVHSCIVGTGKPEHLRRNVEIASRGRLPDIIYNDIRQAFQRHDRGWVGQV